MGLAGQTNGRWAFGACVICACPLTYTCVQSFIFKHLSHAVELRDFLFVVAQVLSNYNVKRETFEGVNCRKFTCSCFVPVTESFLHDC